MVYNFVSLLFSCWLCDHLACLFYISTWGWSHRLGVGFNHTGLQRQRNVVTHSLNMKQFPNIFYFLIFGYIHSVTCLFFFKNIWNSRAHILRLYLILSIRCGNFVIHLPVHDLGIDMNEPKW